MVDRPQNWKDGAVLKKLLFLAALAGGAYAMVKKRQEAAAAEAALWDEATGKTASAPAPVAPAFPTP